MPRRVVITGMGWVTPLGDDLETVWRRLLAGESAIGPVTRFNGATFATNFAAEVRDFSLDRHFDASMLARHASTGLQTQYALAAAQRAWVQAGLARDQIPAHRFGIYLGGGEGPPDFVHFVATNLAGWNPELRRTDAAAWFRAAREMLDPRIDVEQEPHAAVTHVADAFGCGGPGLNCMTACAAGTQAVGEAFEIIRRGDADAMLAGGTHSMIHPLGMTGFIRLTAMSRRRETPQTASRPFDRTRDGFVMGEGAGVLVLESLEHALDRGATPLAELAGYGSTADAFRITDIQPEGFGAQAAMAQALRQAGINPREPGADGRPPVHYISAHGTGTPENDGIETAAVKGVFGPLAPQIPFSSVKSMLGHLIQAAGAVELMTCVLAIKTGCVPPTINLHEADPRCDLDYVPGRARDLNPSGGVQVCISNGFGFGGQNDCVCVKRFE
ncbi:MAG: beta-ketoacyl-[acyl-carrier-protein] synthase family protein [Phycisphaeraceae bacterium]|nr:beta-ketoacyl-[acyl-carrier-protein] synthase family protein [Phycisphaeraceae bacterium]MCW5753837.1 beta-ketoacyl-[acyl-carrier-protein] synthase family protein [Phycisphaeraceae bacterium]